MAAQHMVYNEVICDRQGSAQVLMLIWSMRVLILAHIHSVTKKSIHLQCSLQH